MGFFEDTRVRESVAITIQRVQNLEEQEARKLLRRFKEIRQDLRDRLDALARDTFTAQQTRGVLVQVDAAMQAINQSLKGEIRSGAEKLGVRGVEDLIKEINKYNRMFTGAIIPLNIDAAVIGLDQTNFLINRYETSIDAYTGDVRSFITGQLTNLSIQEVPFDTMIRKLSQFFIGEEWKLRRIARTELHNIYNLSKIEGMKQTQETLIPDLKKTMFHPDDDRTGKDSDAMAGRPSGNISVVSGKQVVNIDQPFRFVLSRTNEDGTKTEIVREFMAPPDRPNDRAILIPFRSEWDQ